MILDRLEQMVGFDPVARGEIGDGARHFEDAVVGAGRERQLLHRVLEHFGEGRVDRAVGADLRVAHARVRGRLGPLESRQLAISRGLHPGADRRRAFARLRVLQLPDRQRRGLDVQVDPVQQGAADLRPVALDLRWRAAAFALGIAQIAARAGVHRRHQHETARERDLAGAPRNGYLAVLQRLAQHLQRAALELWQFVEEQDPVVRERDLAGSRDRAAAEQSHVRDRMMRLPHRASAEDRRSRQRLPGRRVDAEHLERFLQRGQREDRRDPFRDHRFARKPGEPDHDHVVAAGGC